MRGSFGGLWSRERLLWRVSRFLVPSLSVWLALRARGLWNTLLLSWPASILCLWILILLLLLPLPRLHPLGSSCGADRRRVTGARFPINAHHLNTRPFPAVLTFLLSLRHAVRGSLPLEVLLETAQVLSRVLKPGESGALGGGEVKADSRHTSRH